MISIGSVYLSILLMADALFAWAIMAGSEDKGTVKFTFIFFVCHLVGLGVVLLA